MTAPTVVQDCILFAHNSKDLTREGSNKQNTNTNQHQKTPQKPQTNPQKNEIDAGEKVKRCGLVPLNASLRCSPQWCSPSNNSLSHFPKQICIYGILRFWHSFIRRFWIFQLIDTIFGLPFLLPTNCWMFCNLSLFNLKVCPIGFSNRRRQPRKFSDDLGNTLPEPIVLLTTFAQYWVMRQEDNLIMSGTNHVIDQNCHALPETHLQMLLMSNMTSLIPKFRGVIRRHHLESENNRSGCPSHWIRTWWMWSCEVKT